MYIKENLIKKFEMNMQKLIIILMMIKKKLILMNMAINMIFLKQLQEILWLLLKLKKPCEADLMMQR
jgi:hypothetical protein